ncbi:unnamed protein product [Moneuplotes crassus]|uniref:Uncharacterized protein n=1 Tax=Euplotes crassus TaxID=5936 RepID=A0AAD1XZI5_EUPCR|nr:unnamed protein product [Moneuplotes crassus]
MEYSKSDSQFGMARVVAQSPLDIKKISIEDIELEAKLAAMEKRQPKNLQLSSPLSLRACMLENINPFQLKPISLKGLTKKSSSENIAKIRFDYHESKRLALIKLIKLRKEQIGEKKVPKTAKAQNGNLVSLKSTARKYRRLHININSRREATSQSHGRDPPSKLYQPRELKSSHTVERLAKQKKFT